MFLMLKFQLIRQFKQQVMFLFKQQVMFSSLLQVRLGCRFLPHSLRSGPVQSELLAGLGPHSGREALRHRHSLWRDQTEIPSRLRDTHPVHTNRSVS